MPTLAGVNHLDAVRALEKAGFQIRRQDKHVVMTDGTRIVTIVHTGRDGTRVHLRLRSRNRRSYQ
jgi:hypothetical protein